MGHLWLFTGFRTKHPDCTYRQALASDTKLKIGGVLHISERGINRKVCKQMFLIHDFGVLSYSKCKVKQPKLFFFFFFNTYSFLRERERASKGEAEGEGDRRSKAGFTLLIAGSPMWGSNSLTVRS